jgi:outer membrane murein-binding lipoprotein Lpp
MLFLRVALAEANEHLAQWSTEVADLRLLCDELEVEAMAARAEATSARTEAQQRQLELGHVIGERDQSRS